MTEVLADVMTPNGSFIEEKKKTDPGMLLHATEMHSGKLFCNNR